MVTEMDGSRKISGGWTVARKMEESGKMNREGILKAKRLIGYKST